MEKFNQKKEQIKDAGRKMFATYGYHKTTLDDIAGLIKLKKNSLYYYFPNKESLFFEIIQDEVNVHFEKQKKILAQDLSARDKIIKILNSLIIYIRERTTKYSLRIESYLEMTKVIRDLFPDFKKNQCRLITKLLKEGMEKGEFKKHNPEVLADDLEILITAVFNNYYRLSEAEFLHEIDLDAITNTVKRLIAYIFDGIEA
jgi:AcrR family transcriptional regulator